MTKDVGILWNSVTMGTFTINYFPADLLGEF